MKEDFKTVLGIFKNKDAYFYEINSNKSNRLIISQVILICLFAFVYGLTMGSYHSFAQAISAGIKLSVLYLSVLLICFPSFFIIQQILGSKMSIRQMALIILSGFLLMSMVVVSFVPILLLFQITGGNYHFLQLLHVLIFAFGGFFAMRVMVGALKYACEIKEVYPETGMHVFRVWFIILAFVGVQISWNLRPFLCKKDEAFKVFRKHEGNFYTAIIYSFEQLSKGEENEKKINVKTEPYTGYHNEFLYDDTTVLEPEERMNK